MTRGRGKAAGNNPGGRGAGTLGRSAARLAAVQALYAMDVAGDPADKVLGEFLAKRWEPAAGEGTDNDGSDAAEPDRRFLTKLVQGVAGAIGDVDAGIALALNAGWSMDRLESLLRAILRAGAYELMRLEKVPARVVIVEYMHVAEAFFDGNQGAMVNGVLDRMARTLRGDEMTEVEDRESDDAKRGR